MAVKSDVIQAMLGNLMQVISNMVDLHDPSAAGHQCEVALLAKAIAEEMTVDQNVVDCVFIAGQLHDIGKIAIPFEVLAYPGRLNSIGLMAVRCHPEISYQILKFIDFPWPVADAVLEHHERLDGSGYPRGLTGDKMRVESRILAVADVAQAMLTNRPYHLPVATEDVVLELEDHKGSLYDTDVVDCCKRIINLKGAGVMKS